ncbi:hypothetical protein [Rickettsia oklahomensis]|uniref:Uncharacterized protein n=1 Tax=Rickettsia oklahomensis TaxID=3141789 RepID=A0AAU7BZ49_9RICK
MTDLLDKLDYSAKVTNAHKATVFSVHHSIKESIQLIFYTVYDLGLNFINHFKKLPMIR